MGDGNDKRRNPYDGALIVHGRLGMQKRTSKEVIEDLLPLEGATVVDVGCGNGAMTRLLTRKGAHVTGIEVSPRQLARARAVDPVGDEQYMQGLAEELPVSRRSIDIVIYFNSLHHVDSNGMSEALKEASQILKHGGVLYVAEPLPEGPYFEVMKPAHDETRVRHLAQEALRNVAEYGFLQEKAMTHIDTVKIKDFDTFHDRITAINPTVRERFNEIEQEIRANFERLGTEDESGWTFDQPMRVRLFRLTRW